MSPFMEITLTYYFSPLETLLFFTREVNINVVLWSY